LPVSSVIRTLGKIIKIVATRCQILRLKCTKFNFDPAEGAYSAHPDPLAALRGPTSKGRGWTRPHHFTSPLSHISGYAPVEGDGFIIVVDPREYYTWGFCNLACG